MKSVLTLVILLPALLGNALRLCAQPQPGSLLWSFDLGSTILGSPALAPDGTIYVGAASGLFAITNNASVASNKWVSSGSGSAAIGSDGTVYFGTQGGSFYALHPDGTTNWAYQFQGMGKSSPAIGLDGTIYVAATGPFASLFALSAAGAKKWDFIIGYSDSSVAIGAHGDLYIASWDTGKMYSLSRNGTKNWDFRLQSVGESAAVGGDGTIYFTGGSLYAFTPDGTNLWATSVVTFNGSSPVVAKDGTIYVPSSDLSLYSVAPNGQTNWQAVRSVPTVFGMLPTTPAIDAAGTIYTASQTLSLPFHHKARSSGSLPADTL